MYCFALLARREAALLRLPCSEYSPKLDEAPRLDESATHVRVERLIVLQIAVRGDLSETAIARPLRCSLHQRAPDSATAGKRLDIPTFDMRHGARVAPIRKRTDGELDEAGRNGVELGNKRRCDDGDLFTGEKCPRLRSQLSRVGIGPKPGAHRAPHLGVTFLHRADRHGAKVSKDWERGLPFAYPAPMRVTPRVALQSYIAEFSPEIARLARAALATMRKLLPGAVELVYDNAYALVVGFSPNERPSAALFSIAIYPQKIALCFLYGASLPDPGGLLRGGGNQVRSIRNEDAGTLERRAVRALLKTALEAAGNPYPGTGKGTTIVRAVSKNRRPRRRA